MSAHRRALKAIQQAIEPIRSAVGHALADDAAPDPIPDSRFSMEYEIPAMLYWEWCKGERRTRDYPGDPPHLEDEVVMLGEHDITDLLSPEALADVREAMLSEMEGGE